MNFDAESLHQQIPFYLTSEDRKVLVRELEAIASGGSADYFLSPYHDTFKENVLQGDGWRGLQLFIFETGERLTVGGLVLSNSCDIDPENQRDLPARVTFAPLVKLSTYEKLLRGSGIGVERIDKKIATIKAQKTTNMFYIPAGGPISEDYVVRLDDVHSMPITAHARSSEREKLFTLSNTGFYMLVLKLSVHFCRLHEKLNRKSPPSVET